MIVVVVILLILLAIIASGVIKAKARMHHADDVRAQRDVLNGSNAKPSWIDTKREEEFFKFTVKLAQEKGVPRSFVMKGFMSPEASAALFAYVASLERRGRSFSDQVVSGADYVAGAWHELPEHVREDFQAAAGRL